MRLIVFSLLFSTAVFASIGDNAPSIPSTYVTSHPRLPYPDATFLAKICNNGGSGGTTSPNDGCSMTPRYRAAAEAWNSSSPSGHINARYLLIAYLATKNKGTANSTYLAKIQGLASTALGSFSSPWDAAVTLSLTYDWCFSDLGSGLQPTMRSSLYTLMSNFETSHTGYSPYNDQFYISDFTTIPHLVTALAVYPDDAPNSLPHLRYAMDLWFNQLVPVWKQVIGGTYCGTSSDASNDCGGAWHEAWQGYVNAEGYQGDGLNTWYVSSMLAWAVASGRGVSQVFTSDYPWMKNFAYQLAYTVRPDWTVEPLQPSAGPYWDSEYNGLGNAELGMLDGLAAIYNDPTLRGWSRAVNWNNAAPDGFEPSAWPYYQPDSSANSTNPRSALTTTKNFPGYGLVVFRTGWTENDTFCTLRYGDSYWSHPVEDTGAFTCYNRGPLAIRSGDYKPGSASEHFQGYAAQAISQNVPLVYDPKDVYNAEALGFDLNTGASANENMPNDGGQRRVGSSLGNYTGTNPNVSIGAMQIAPPDTAQWMRAREYYHQGRLIGYATGSGNTYSFAAVDMTAAYNNTWSRNAYSSSNTWAYNTANTSNRSFRVQKAVREFLFIPRGTAAYVVVYDQVISSNASFVKKDLIHSINQPTISGNSYTIARTELITDRYNPGAWLGLWYRNIANCPGGCAYDSTQYQYNGKLYGWLTIPSGAALNTVGGPGHEFQITDANGTKNWNQCMQGLCPTGIGLGSTTDLIAEDPTSGPWQVGGWRIEETPATSETADQFINVMLVTSASDANTVSTAPVTTSEAAGVGACVSGTPGGCYVTTWKDNNNTCTYTVTQPVDGIGGTLTIQGSGCSKVIN